MHEDTCTRCLAPHGVTVYRRQFSVTWTSSAIEASRDPRFDPRPHLIALNDQGLCQACAPRVRP